MTEVGGRHGWLRTITTAQQELSMIIPRAPRPLAGEPRLILSVASPARTLVPVPSRLARRSSCSSPAGCRPDVPSAAVASRTRAFVRTTALCLLAVLAVVGAVLVPGRADAATVVGPGTWENGSSAISFDGTWTTERSKRDSGGSASRLTTAGSAELSFRASGVRWVARKNRISGIADVYVDGVKKARVDLYSKKTRPQQVVYEASGLPRATHSIRIVRTGAKNARSAGTGVQLDAFVVPDSGAPAAPTNLKAAASGNDVTLTWAASADSDVTEYRAYRREESSTPRTLVGSTKPDVLTLTDADRQPGVSYAYEVVAVDASGNVSPSSTSASVTVPVSARPAGRYEDDSAAVTMRGHWSGVTSSADSGGSHAALDAAGYTQISFATSGIRWVSRLDDSSGIADVYLDGVKKTSVDLYAATPKNQQVVYETKGLAGTAHTLRILWTGRKNAASSGSRITLDAFVAPDENAPGAPSGLEAVASGADVRLTWAANAESDLKGYRVYRRDGKGAPRTLVGTTPAGTTSLTDPDRTPGSTYVYDIVAFDTSDNESDPSSSATVTIRVPGEGAGTFENDSSAVVLNGPWSLVSSRTDSGGSYATLDADGYAQVSFTTSGIRWVSRVNNYSGIADVYLDGVKTTSVDLYSPTTKAQQVVYEVKGLPEVPHTLRIVHTGRKNDSSRSSTIIVDSFVAPDIYAPAPPTGLVGTAGTASVELAWKASRERDVVGYRIYRGSTSGALTAITSEPVDETTYVDTPLKPGDSYRYQVTAVDADGNESPRSEIVESAVPMSALPAGTYEDDGPEVVKQGPWSRVASSAANTDSGGSFSTLGGDGYVELTFATSGIRWLARTNAYSGRADVYIDGVRKATVDLYSPTTRYAQTVFAVDGLGEGTHTIRIVRTGTKSDASAGRGITLDAFVAPDVQAPSTPAALKVRETRTGAQLSWTKSPERDVAGYRVFRRADSSQEPVLVGTTSARSTTFTDVGLAASTRFSWTVVARDASGNDSAPSAAAQLTTGPDPYAAHPFRYATCPAATVTVSTRSELLAAISAATSGTVIRLNPGSYGANYLITTKASAERPLWICGPRTAVFDNGDVKKGYGIRFNGAAHVVVAGMTVRNVQKGVSAQYSRNLTVADLRVEQIGDEAIHLKNMTTDSTVIGNVIDTTGLNAKNYGEGVYVGTAQSNWCLYNGCQPDTSDRNVVAFNDIRGTTAEAIEAKASTNDGTMWKNTLDGAAISADDADSLIQVMGSGWVIAQNTGSHAPDDAIQVWNTDEGSYGLDNVVYANVVTDALPGYAVHLPYVDAGNVVGCDNAATGAGKGMSNKPCQN